jgi:hypothetical protein
VVLELLKLYLRVSACSIHSQLHHFNSTFIYEGVKRRFPIIIVEGSGRASDAMAAYIKHFTDPKKFHFFFFLVSCFNYLCLFANSPLCRYDLGVWDQFKAEAWPNISTEQEQKLNSNLLEVKEKEQGRAE